MPARRERPFDPSQLVFRWATPSRWSDVETLFGERGACGGCWCMTWRLERKAFDAGKSLGNKRALKRLVTDGTRPGVIAYFGRDAVAWCAVAPRTAYSYLARSRVLSPIDDRPVWSVTCFFVAKPYRGRGVSTRLLRATAEMAMARGAKIVEGYPQVPYRTKAPDTFMWTGLPGAFERAGFVEVARRSRTRPIMRFEG